MRVLLVEDNPEIADAVRRMLERERYAVTHVGDGEAALTHLIDGEYDLAVLDLVLPRRDGFTVCAQARQEGVSTPVLMLTARDAIEDRVRGLDCGADDYLIKPFEAAELVARVHALLRRSDRPPQRVFTAGPLSVDVTARTASVAGRELDLGSTEFRLLEYLARNVGIALSRGQILDRVWGDEFAGSSNIVDVYVGQLRRKLRGAGADGLSATVWGVGYRLVT
ncbi:MAG: response regulator transcription factor [Candidatus Eremiobacteraeota bacterium]|nr:response regulator transcription factor [Candidatus Eremiobacteraeota bacterium]